LSHCCHTVATLLPHCCHTVVTLLSHCCHTVVTLLSQCCHTAVTLLSHCCYTVATLLSHCCHTVVPLLLRGHFGTRLTVYLLSGEVNDLIDPPVLPPPRLSGRRLSAGISRVIS
jgi:hypothetical protein